MDDPMIERVTKDAQKIGAWVLYLPHATYPVHIRGLGGCSLDDARRLRNELTAVLKLVADESGEK